MPFTGYHGMLEESFRRRVLAGLEGVENAAALYTVARAMGEEEDLWVPAARFDAQAHRSIACWKDAGRHRQVTHVLDDFRNWTPKALDMNRLRRGVLPHLW